MVQAIANTASSLDKRKKIQNRQTVGFLVSFCFVAFRLQNLFAGPMSFWFTNFCNLIIADLDMKMKTTMTLLEEDINSYAPMDMIDYKKETKTHCSLTSSSFNRSYCFLTRKYDQLAVMLKNHILSLLQGPHFPLPAREKSDALANERAVVTAFDFHPEWIGVNWIMC